MFSATIQGLCTDKRCLRAVLYQIYYFIVFYQLRAVNLFAFDGSLSVSLISTTCKMHRTGPVLWLPSWQWRDWCVYSVCVHGWGYVWITFSRRNLTLSWVGVLCHNTLQWDLQATHSTIDMNHSFHAIPDYGSQMTVINICV